MSEVQSRPARGRSSARGGRGSYASRGARKQTNGDGASSNIDTSAEAGELAELKKRYQNELSMLKELFPDWTDADLVLAIEDSDGDLERTIEKISEGTVSQFSEVPKKAKDRSRSKAKENVVPTDGTSSIRGARGDAPRRGTDSVRGGRGRGTDRGRGGFGGTTRGGRGGATSGPRAASSVPTTESSAWDTTPAAAQPTENGQASEAAKDDGEHKSKVEVTKEVVKDAAKKTWASMFSTPKPAPAPAKPTEKAAPAPEETKTAPSETPAHEVAQEPAVHAEELPIPPVADEAVKTPPVAVEETAKSTPETGISASGPDLTLTPSKDKLTEENVEHLPDTSEPPATETAFSTVASSRDIGSAVATPLGTNSQPAIGRPGMGGFATSALKATSSSGHRSASFQRRLMEQQEAVVMPGNHAVDRTAVQFGSLGLGDSSEMDADEEREDAETREQPPQHSPVAQPRTALPPAPRQTLPATEAQPEAIPTPKQAPGLPPVSHQQQQQPFSQQSPLGAHSMQAQGSQSNQRYEQFGRYGQPGAQSEAAAPPQKPYDPFGQQIPSQSSQYDYPGQQSQAPSQSGAFSSAPDNFGSQYLTSEQRYQNYYGNYGQQGNPSQQDLGSAQQRTGSAFGSGPNDSAFSQGQQQQVRAHTRDISFERLSQPPSYKPSAVHRHGSDPIFSESRSGESDQFGDGGTQRTTTGLELQHSSRQFSNDRQQGQGRYDAQNSGHNTPNPGQQPGAPGSQGQHMQQQQQHGGQQGHSQGYPYNHPYYGSPYYANYMNQFGGYGQGGGYGSFGKGMYGQPHHYGMSPQAAYEQHSSSPANAGAFGAGAGAGASALHERSGGLGDYGRSASGTSQNHSATAGAGGFGGFPDTFGRQQGYSSHSSYGQQQGGQPGASEDSLKPFGDSKSSGPSPSALGAQQGRPGSATQNTPGQTGPQQSHQQGFGGYPGHLGGNNSQYGGLGGLGHQGSGNHQQQSQYGNYGGFGGGYGSGSYSRGGWGGNYGHN